MTRPFALLLAVGLFFVGSEVPHIVPVQIVSLSHGIYGLLNEQHGFNGKSLRNFVRCMLCQ